MPAGPSIDLREPEAPRPHLDLGFNPLFAARRELGFVLFSQVAVGVLHLELPTQRSQIRHIVGLGQADDDVTHGRQSRSTPGSAPLTDLLTGQHMTASYAVHGPLHLASGVALQKLAGATQSGK